MKMTRDDVKNVRMRQKETEKQISPITLKIELSERTDRCQRRVNAGDVDVYVPMNALIEIASRILLWTCQECCRGDCAKRRGQDGWW